MTALANVLSTDVLGVLLTELVGQYRPRTILEIGSSDGTGSTRVFAEAIEGSRTKLFCIEMEKDRYDSLVLNMRGYTNVWPYRCASVGVHGLMRREYIDEFRAAHPKFTMWQVMSKEEIYKWYDNSVLQIPAQEISEGISRIKYDHALEAFDMVFMDGSPFTGMAELELVHGSGIIIMDDTMDIKCYDTMMALLNDDTYELLFRDDKYRNGFAIFKLKNYAHS